MKKIVALLLIAFSFSSCEKDDICTDETTPRLIIEFYDITNPAEHKEVTDLKVKGDGADDFIVFDETLAGNNPDRFLCNDDKISLPLRINGTSTVYHLILNSTNPTFINEDILQFNYTTDNVFVSRACGYKTVFELDSPGGVIVSDAGTPDTLWIKQNNINIQTTTIETENEVHVKIYF